MDPGDGCVVSGAVFAVFAIFAICDAFAIFATVGGGCAFAIFAIRDARSISIVTSLLIHTKLLHISIATT